MQYIRPSYYDKFKCIGADCPDTCCRGWQIMIDEETMQHYQKMQGSLGESIRAGLDVEQSCFKQKANGDCHFLREDGLCQIFWTSQKEEDWCDTCRSYPRHIEEFEEVREISLGMSCPEAARIIFEEKETLSFLMEEDEEYEEYEEFDYLLYSKLLDSRELLLRILQERTRPLRERLLSAEKLGRALQDAIDENRIFEMDDILKKAEREIAEAEGRKEAKKKLFQNQVEKKREAEEFSEEELSPRFEERKKLFSYLKEFELLRDSWKKDRDQAEKLLYQVGAKDYARAVQSFYQEGYAEGWESWESAMEQIAVYFIFIYFCGAVYDDWLIEKVEMAVFSVKIIEEMAIASMLAKGKPVDRRELIRISSGFCRELEHSDENLNLLEELLYEGE